MDNTFSKKLYLYISDFKNYLIKFFEIQLYINLVALPILIAWGLPISIISPLGNLIFSPIMTLFMFISSIIFFTEISGIPNSFFILVLEKITLLWNYILNYANHKSLIFLPCSPLLLTIVLMFSILLISWIKNISSVKRILLFLCLFFCFYGMTNNSGIKKNFLIDVTSSKAKADLLKVCNKIYLFDDGAISRARSFNSWADYVLLPKLIQNSGSNKIDYLVINKINDVSLTNLQYLLSKIYVGTICVSGSDTIIREDCGLWQDVKFESSINCDVKVYVHKKFCSSKKK